LLAQATKKEVDPAEIEIEIAGDYKLCKKQAQYNYYFFL
jgi:hypothetical protein